jgi:hypothetical protein
MRKIIQIVESPETELAYGSLAALCNDGSLWFFCKGKWELHEHEIPQDGYVSNEPDFNVGDGGLL